MKTAVKSHNDVDAAYTSAQKVVETHHRIAEFLHKGVTLAQIDRFVFETLEDLGCKSCFHKYRTGGLPPFPSQACLSVNNCVVHGTAAYYLDPLKSGDVLSIDIGVKHKGWMGDAAWTYVFDEMTPEVKKLTDSGKESLAKGIEQLQPGNKWSDWARTVQRIVEDEYGFHLIRGLGGHGYGRKLHTPPWISNVVPEYAHEWPDGEKIIESGSLVAVEPMISVGTSEIAQKPRDWPIYSADNTLSVHYEHDVLVTADGPRILTDGLQTVTDVITR